jgi:hypothetical protein
LPGGGAAPDGLAARRRGGPAALGPATHIGALVSDAVDGITVRMARAEPSMIGREA